MDQITLRVKGIHCEGCEQRIEKALTRLDGVRSCRADHRSGEVEVVFEASRTPEQAVRTCITHAGFEVSR
jgi:copper chaperone CopZ